MNKTFRVEEINLKKALRSIRTDSARLHLLKLLDAKGSTEASKLLLSKLEKSQHFIELGDAAKIALKIGQIKKAKQLFTKAAKKAIAKSALNAFYYIKELLYLDKKVALNLFKEFESTIQERAKAMGDTWHYYYHPLSYMADKLGEKNLATKYLKLALKKALSEIYLTPKEINDVICIMKELGEKERAKKFAREYLEERLSLFVCERKRIKILKNYLLAGAAPDQLEKEEYKKEFLKICVEAGFGKKILNDLKKIIRLGIKENEIFTVCIKAVEDLAYLLNEELPRRIYLIVAKNYESKGFFSEAREYYQKAGCLDSKTDERIATKELEHLKLIILKKSPVRYINMWNTLAYFFEDRKKSSFIIEPTLISMLGYEADIQRVIELSRKLTDEKVKKRILEDIVNGLVVRKFYNYAAKVAEELDRSLAKRLWAKASLYFELNAKSEPNNELAMLNAALICAKMSENRLRQIRLQKILIEKLMKSSNNNISLYEEIAKDISREFFRLHKNLCMHVIEYLKKKKRYVQLGRLLLRLGIVDRKVLEQALFQLEKAEKYSEAADVAKVLGDKESVKIYSIMGRLNR